MSGTRPLNTACLTGTAEFYVKEFNKPSVRRIGNDQIWSGGRSYVLKQLHKMRYKDEHAFVVQRMEELFDQDDLRTFRKAQADWFEPRDDAVFEQLLQEWLAINPAGEHVPGVIGKSEIGRRVVGSEMVKRPQWRLRPKARTLAQRLFFLNGRLVDRLTFRPWTVNPELVGYVEKKKLLTWPVYAGEQWERERETGVADELPAGALPWSEFPDVLATNPKMSNVAAVLACDAIVDDLDSGSTAANIRGRTGSQPADVDATESGTLLFTLVMSDPAFGNAADDTGKATATASSITDDSSADATGTLGYCRCAATGTNADDVLDGEAGTSGSDFNFDSLSISAGTTVEMTAFTVSVSE